MFEIGLGIFDIGILDTSPMMSGIDQVWGTLGTGTEGGMEEKLV